MKHNNMPLNLQEIYIMAKQLNVISTLTIGRTIKRQIVQDNSSQYTALDRSDTCYLVYM